MSKLPVSIADVWFYAYSFFSPGGSNEKYQQYSSAIPLYQTRSLPQLYKVMSTKVFHQCWLKCGVVFFFLFGFLFLVLTECFLFICVRFKIEQPVYINIIRDPINRFLSNYFFRRFGDWRGEQNHLIRTPGMKDDERYLVRSFSAEIHFIFEKP